MVVELFGVPGSGKSTSVAIAATKIRFLARHDITKAWSRQGRFHRYAVLATDHARPSRVWAVVWFALTTRITRIESLWRLSRLLAKSCRLRSTAGLILLDQGLLQELWSILYAAGAHSIDPARAAPLIEKLYEGIGAQIIFLEIDPEVAAARISKRVKGHSRLDGSDIEKIHEDLASAAALPGCLAEAARLAGIPVQSIDGSMPTGLIATNVLAAVERSLVSMQ